MADLQLDEGYVTVRRGKGAKGRFVPIDEVGIQALTAYLLDTRSVLYSGDTSGRVFPITRQRLWQIVGSLCRLAGLPESKHPHQLLHRFGSELVKAGLELRQVAAMMGHASTDTTEIYVGLDLEDLQKIFR
jgi:site-specific recombinase XerD